MTFLQQLLAVSDITKINKYPSNHGIQISKHLGSKDMSYTVLCSEIIKIKYYSLYLWGKNNLMSALQK